MYKTELKFCAITPGVDFAEINNEKSEQKRRRDIAQNRDKQICAVRVALRDKNRTQTDGVKQPSRRIINPKLIVFFRHQTNESL
jgi:hypothetical protein